MKKKLNKAYSRNSRLDKPCGLVGVPPDAPFIRKAHNVVIIAHLTDGQIDELTDILYEMTRISLPQ